MRSLRFLLIMSVFVPPVLANPVKQEIRYLEDDHPRHLLDLYVPPHGKNLPVVFWIHGGGWETGDKGSVQEKPRFFNERGFVFVSTNYRLLPEVEMENLVADVVSALAWVHRHVAEHGGDPNRIVVGGHSAGAQLAALLCTDDRLLAREKVPFSALRGCLPVDGDTYDIPAIIETAETRQRAHGFPLPTRGHRQKFGHTPEKHRDFSAVTHVAPDKGIPPFLILHVAGHPDVTAQAKRLGQVLAAAGVPVTVHGQGGTDHNRLNAALGTEGDPATAALIEFLASITK